MKRLLHLPLVAALLVTTAACDARDPGEATLTQNVGASFAPCNAAEIRFLAAKHNVMTAFEPCGNNNFQHYAWSPDGRMLYFQLVLVAHVMNADAPDRAVITVPTETPIGPAAWLDASRLAVPVGPKAPDAPNRLVIFDQEQRSLYEHALPGLEKILAVQRGATPQHALVLASDEAGRRAIYRVDTADGTIDQPFAFVTGDVDTFTYTPSVDALVVGQADATTVFVATTGERRGTFSPATRGTVHPDGRWLALEHEGAPVSIFYQRSWDELSDRARERELARSKKFEEQFAERSDFPTHVQPPTLSFVDLAAGERFYLDSLYGSGFSWYEPTPFYGSVLLWGFEGKEFKPNVVLGNMADRLKTMERGGVMTGVKRMEDAKAEGFVAGLLPQRAPVGAPETAQGPAEAP